MEVIEMVKVKQILSRMFFLDEVWEYALLCKNGSPSTLLFFKKKTKKSLSVYFWVPSYRVIRSRP